MQITVEVPDQKIVALVRQRIDELFSDDFRLRDSAVRDLVRRLVDEVAVSAVRQAKEKLSAEIPAIAEESVRRALKEECDKATKRGLSALRKLYSGFDPRELTSEQRAWLERQIAGSANDGEPKEGNA